MSSRLCVKFKPKIQTTSANQHGTKVILNKLRREQTARNKKQIKESIKLSHNWAERSKTPNINPNST